MKSQQRFRLSTGELCQELRISAQTLRRLRKEGFLRPGSHYIAKGVGRKAPHLLWDPDPIQEILATRAKRILKP